MLSAACENFDFVFDENLDSQKSNEEKTSLFRSMQYRASILLPEKKLSSALRRKSTVLWCHAERLCNQGNKQQAQKMVRLAGEVWSEHWIPEYSYS